MKVNGLSIRKSALGWHIEGELRSYERLEDLLLWIALRQTNQLLTERIL